MKQILILGGGAAGIVAAIAAAEQAGESGRVTILEANPKLGKKLLATGNGRCNLDHAGLGAEDYFTSDRDTLARMLEHIGEFAVTDWFHAHGLMTTVDEAGRVYPYSNQAADVLELLIGWLDRLGVRVRTECSVSAVEPGKVTLESGEEIFADAIICAMGGNAAPQFGSDGMGITLLRPMGYKATALYPCLVPLKCGKGQVHGLSGVRVKGAAGLYDGDKLIRREVGEIQFTDYGLSGIAVMQLSGHLGQQRKLRKAHIRLDLFPQMGEDDLCTFLSERAKLLPGCDGEGFMTGLLHKRVGKVVWRSLGLGEMTRKMDTLSRAEWMNMAQGLKNWAFDQLEDTGWKNAQTTGGGLRLSYLEEDSFQLKNTPGVYAVGECVDCAGSCGGYNLHFAFGSGILAGRHAARVR